MTSKSKGELIKYEFAKGAIFLYGSWCPFIYKEGNMQKVNAMPIYWLASAIGQLQAQLTPPVKVGALTSLLITARGNLEFFIGSYAQALPLSKDAASEIIVRIDQIIVPERLKQPDAIIPQQEIDFLSVSIYNFQAVLGTELPRINVFYITPKRAYDMTMLINQGESVLSPDIINLLGPKEDVIKDIREATKSMAFDISTAVGFHVYRAVETIVKEYFPILEIQPEDWQSNKNLGNYIKLLEDKGVDVKVTTMLRHLKDHYRNPISHPEEFWGSDKAESAFMLAVSVITVMVQDIEETKIKGAATTP